MSCRLTSAAATSSGRWRSLSRPPAGETPAPVEEPQPVNGRAGALTIQRVDTVNIYVTVVNGGVGDDPSLITVQGQ